MTGMGRKKERRKKLGPMYRAPTSAKAAELDVEEGVMYMAPSSNALER
jgi:hypothetical protein